MFKTKEEFDPIIRKEWESPVVLDGITCLKKYNAAPIKILWVLKEGNEHEKVERDHRKFHQDVTVYPNWKSTYKNIIFPTYGILHNLEYNNLPPLNDDATVNDDYILENIALININKNGGTGRSNRTVIESHYSKHKDVLLQQIEGINPDVIINCSRVNRLFNDVAEKYGLEKRQFISEYNKTVYYALNSEKLIIDYWPPNVRAFTVSTEAYQKQLLDIYKLWKDK